MSTFKSNKIISKPNLQPVNSPTISEQSPATTKDQQAQMDRIPTLESILPPSNLTDIESFDQNHEVSPKSRRTESSSVYEEAVDTTYQYLQQQLPQQPTNTSIISKNSSNEAIPVSIKLSQLPNNSSSSLFINNRTRQPNSPSVNSQRGHSKSPSKNSHFSTRDEPIKENLKPSSESSSASTHSLESPITPLIRKTKPSSQSIQNQQQKSPSSSMVSPGLLITQQESTDSQHQPSPALSHLSVSTFGHKKRESMLSTYSGAVEYDAVPMTVKRSSSSKIKYVGNASQGNANNNNYNNMVSSRAHHRKRSSLSSTSTSNKYSDLNTVSDTKLIETSQLLGGDANNSNNNSNNTSNSSRRNRSYYDGDEEEEDDSSILMGKLPTRSSKEDELKAQQPDKSVTTNIEGSIPARSPRRPASVMSPNFSSIDMINSSSISNNTTGSKDKSRRKSYVEDNKRRSIQINDGLEKLMLDATSFTSQDENEQQEHEEADYDNTRFIKDVTPNHLNIHRKNDADEYNEDDDITPKFDPSLVAAGSHNGVGIDELDNNIPISSRNSSYELWSRHESKRKSLTQPLNLPPRPTKDNLTKARTISNNLQQQQQQQQNLREHYDTLDGNPDNLNATEGEEILPSTNNYVDDEEYGQEGMPRSQKTNHHVVDDNDDDDGFYDITGEPVIVQPPLVRAKSVKNSIKRPSRHTKSSKDKHNHNSNDSENHHNGKKHHGSGSSSKKHRNNKKSRGTNGGGGLKPFSYTTLISLLESMNGTIIGEEFNQLNIPIKEKQLIEKIIDSLSRLTSDMILDQQRYEVGIDRLEKCLRVLEGFM